MIFNKKHLWIFLASPIQKTHHETFWVWTVLVLLWFRIIGKTIKTYGFHNNTFAQVLMYHQEVYSEPCQTSKMKRFLKIVSNF